MYDYLNNKTKILLPPIIATLLAEFITLPICTIKTNYQNTQSNSILKTILDIYNKNGVKSFYNASFFAMFSQVLSTTSKYTLYKYMDSTKIITDNKIINGSISGVITTIFTHPIDTIKIYLQMEDSISKEIRKNGIQILYRGYTKTLSKIAVASACYFPIYDYSKNYYNNTILASTISGFISTIIIHPFDFLKTRHIYNLNYYNGIDLRFYYKGLIINFLRIIPHFIITMTVIEYITSYSNN